MNVHAIELNYDIESTRLGEEEEDPTNCRSSRQEEQVQINGV